MFLLLLYFIEIIIFGIFFRLITLRITTCLVDLFWRRKQMVAIGEKIIDLVIDSKLNDNPIILHCFSNGGAYMYQNFIIALDKTPKPLGVSFRLSRHHKLLAAP